MTTPGVHWNFPQYHWDNPTRSEGVKLAEASNTNTHTGDTDHTAIVSATFTKDEIAAGDIVKVMALWQDSSNTNNNPCKVYVGTPGSGTQVYSAGGTTVQSVMAEILICFDSNTTTVGFPNTVGTATGTSTTVPYTVSGLNLSANGVTVSIGTKLANAGDTVTLHGYTISLIKKAT